MHVYQVDWMFPPLSQTKPWGVLVGNLSSFGGDLLQSAFLPPSGLINIPAVKGINVKADRESMSPLTNSLFCPV